jgi:hypothetical protein
VIEAKGQVEIDGEVKEYKKYSTSRDRTPWLYDKEFEYVP